MSVAALRLSPNLARLNAAFLALWVVVAVFPVLWITLMSTKLPLDALADDPLRVLTGPATRAAGSGLTLLDLVAAAVGIAATLLLVPPLAGQAARALGAERRPAAGWLSASVLVVAGVALAGWALRAAVLAADDAAGLPTVLGFTMQHYAAVWVRLGFYRNFINSAVVTAGVVVISLSVGTLAGYALSRATSRWAFWLLIVALVFRALPQSVLVAGYLPPFINSHAILLPLWQAPVLGPVLHLFAAEPPTLYGQPLAVIFVLVSINQPFTIWMLRSFFATIPSELDEAARVDGCGDFGAFRRVILPVMWPGVVTTGLFSFLLAYNDYLVCALLLDSQSQTMVPAITGFFNRETTSTDQIEAIAAAVSIIAPLFVLIMVFQRQIVSGLTAGAVKG